MLHFKTLTFLLNAMFYLNDQGSMGALDLTQVDTSELQRIVEQGRRLHPRGSMTVRLLHAAAALLCIRVAVLQSQWSQTRMVALESAGLLHAVPSAAEEATLAAREAANQIAISELTTALSCGSASGRSDCLDTSFIVTAQLDEAISKAQALPLTSSGSNTLLTTALLVRRLREAQKSQNWGLVSEVLHDANLPGFADPCSPAASKKSSDSTNIIAESDRGLSGLGVARVSLTELQLAWESCSFYRCVRQLCAALRQGGVPEGVVAAAGSSRTVDSQGLQVAMIEARQQSSAPVLLALLGLCRYLYCLRTAVSAGDWEVCLMQFIS